MKVILPPAIDRLSVREKRLLGFGFVSVLAFAAYMLTPGEGDEGVELATPPAAAPATVTPVAPPATVPVPPPAPVVPAPVIAAPPVAVAPAAASPQGFVLKGVFGGGPRGGSAIVMVPGGQQRRVPIGREIAPGVTLKAVGLSYAVITGANGDQRLELERTTTQNPGETVAPPN